METAAFLSALSIALYFSQMFLSRSLALAGCALAFQAGSQLLAQKVPADLEAIPHSDAYILHTWDPQDGLPDSEVQSITQTSDGYLWLAGLNGLARFDGAQFTRISESSGLTPNSATTTFRAHNGRLWVGMAQGGLAHLCDTRFQIVVPPSSNTTAQILSLAEDSAGGIWASFSAGGNVIRWKNGKVTTLYTGEWDTPISLCSDTDGTLWFASYRDSGVFDGLAFHTFPGTGDGCAVLTGARKGGIWTVCGQQLLRLRKNGGAEIAADLSWLGGSTQVTALYEDRDDNLWIGTQGVGLLRFHDGKFERVPTSFSWINCIYEDREGNLWVGTHGAGLNRLSPKRFFIHAAPTDRSHNPVGPRWVGVSSVVVDNKGLVWMTQGLSLVRAKDASNREFTVAPGWTGPNGAFNLNADPSGGVWIGGIPLNLRYWKDEKLNAQIPIPGNLASFLIGNLPGHVWVATKTNQGVYDQYGTISNLLTKGAGITDPVCLAADPQGRLWVGTTEGRVYYREGEKFTEVPMPAPAPGNMVSFLVPDGPDTVWIGSLMSGLYRWHAGKIDKLPPDSGIPSRNLKLLEIEPNGNFWFGTDQRLFRVARTELEAVLAGREETLQTIAYGSNSGMPAAVNFELGFLHASARTPDGHLWFATTFGGLEVVPEDVSTTAAPPSVLIEDLLAGGKSIPSSEAGKPLMLPAQAGAIQIRYTLPELSVPEQVRFRHRLLGSADESWSASDSLRSTTFANLPPGNYTFEVAARDPINPRQPNPATISFTIQAAWWETLWFRLGCILVGAIAIAAIVRTIVQRRMQARIRRLEQEHALDRERARIARDMHDELGASLTHIMLMSESAAADSPAPELERIAEAARTVSSTLDQIVWATNPRNDTLESLVNYITEFAQEYLETAGIEFRPELPTQLPERAISSERRHDILLVVREAINNVVKHSEAHQVRLPVTIDDDHLQIIIRDDGKGFHAQDVASTSNGLVNMRHRMESAGGEAKIESQPGHGTAITLSMKL